MTGAGDESWKRRLGEERSLPEIRANSVHHFIIKDIEGQDKFSKASIEDEKKIWKLITQIFKHPEDKINVSKGGVWFIDTKLDLDIAQIKIIGEYPIKLIKNHRLSTSRGVISNPQFRFVTDEEVTLELAGQKVIKCERQHYFKDNKLYPSNKFTLTFDSPERPEKVNVMHLRVNVDEYIPTPMRCGICQEYNHTKKWCKNNAKPVCGRCSEEHETKDCKNTDFKCYHCQAPHGTFSKECPIYKQEAEIKIIQEREKLTYQQAKIKITTKRPPPPQYATVAGATVTKKELSNFKSEISDFKDQIGDYLTDQINQVQHALEKQISLLVNAIANLVTQVKPGGSTDASAISNPYSAESIQYIESLLRSDRASPMDDSPADSMLKRSFSDVSGSTISKDNSDDPEEKRGRPRKQRNSGRSRNPPHNQGKPKNK